MAAVAKIAALLLLVCLASGLQKEKRAPKKLKMGFVYVGKINDFGWSYAHNSGRIHLESRYPDIVTTVIREEVIEGTEAPVIAELIEKEGCNFICATSFGFQDATLASAKKHPDIFYLHASGYLRADNMGNMFGKIYQSRYLAGMIAGSMGLKLGYIAAFPIPEVVRGANAYFLGARRTNPKAQMDLHWTLTWFKPDLELYAAEQLLDNNDVGVIAQHQDTTEPQWAANKRNKFSIGYNTDMGQWVSRSVLTSPIFLWGVMYDKFVQDAINGEFHGDIIWWGYEEGGVDIAPISVEVDAKTVAEVEKVKSELKVGKDRIFCGDAVKALNPGSDGCVPPEQLLSDAILLPEINNVGEIAIPTTEVKLSTGVVIFIIVLASLAIFVNVVLGVMVFILRGQRVIRYSSPLFMYAMLGGGLLLYTAVILWMPVPNDPLCIMPLWLLSLGFSLLFGNLLAKTWRIFYMFRRLRKFKYVSISDVMLLPITGVILLVDIVLLILFTFINIPEARKYGFQDDSELSEYEFRWQCDYPESSAIMFFIIVGWKGLQILAGCVLSILTRNVSHDFNEAKHITFAIYVVAFTSVVVFPIIFLVNVYESVVIVQSLGVIVGTFCATGILFFPKFLSIVFGIEDENGSTGATGGLSANGKSDSTLGHS
eukprot:CAMPEP_0177654448 /NCGR_PEP_ID=MMETSP0447-20121125/14339_1 /TAXON_ID=0 /ORGANISM="Stygamoeba regulata, Strain BSH-02190019" /LENGTH=653 /DNA_ID=CAMNT_0019158101 /DNA_START=193 /DNA_END=2154 /DNA_ORIENTATION=+